MPITRLMRERVAKPDSQLMNKKLIVLRVCGLELDALSTPILRKRIDKI
jgi:hypothetical protein